MTADLIHQMWLALPLTLIPVGHEDAGHELLLAVCAETVTDHDLLFCELALQIQSISPVKMHLSYKSKSFFFQLKYSTWCQIQTIQLRKYETNIFTSFCCYFHSLLCLWKMDMGIISTIKQMLSFNIGTCIFSNFMSLDTFFSLRNVK